MEAYEERDVKRDSFEEVDRILAIVEESKKKSDREEAVANLFLTVLYTLMAVLGVITAYFYYKGSLDKEIGFIALIISILFIFQTFYFSDKKLRVKREFERTRKQATEVIREVIPVLSRSERWSSLRKFELRLRLSKLGINAEAIFGREFDLP